MPWKILPFVQPQGGPTNTSCPVGTPENEDKKMKKWSDSSRKQLEARQRGGYD
ncbi:hypothetical protein DPMN_054745 [Dreissena polymorpha]|uniref:Uncharacterized protein n=1 Tax=Dreissena polymorpha TaxID=45954 RepID=A0A9D4HRJ7_DREPO|nr:hypothetical protein DPMN_054745 [Dreissena polymorpha]